MRRECRVKVRLVAGLADESGWFRLKRPSRIGVRLPRGRCELETEQPHVKDT